MEWDTCLWVSVLFLAREKLAQENSGTERGLRI